MVEINNLTNSIINEKFLEKVAKSVLRGEKQTCLSAGREKADLSIALVGQARIRELNKKYRKKNKATDVLAFLELKVPFQKMQALGEIIICPEEVSKNAKKFGFAFKKEIARVLIHGILHLLGYDHEKNKPAAQKMQDKEVIYLSRISL